MRTLEWLIVVLASPAIAWLVASRRTWPSWIRYATLASLVLLPIHAWVEGPHWQMAPIYLAVLLLIYPLFQSFRSGKPGLGKIASILLGTLVGLLTIAGLAICYALPMFHLSKPSGPYPVGTRTFYFTDPSRMETHPGAPHIQREVVAQLWFPSATSHGKHAVYRQWGETDPRSTYQSVLRVDSLQDAPFASGRFPVVIFNHAWRGFRNRSTFIDQELASQGFVVVAISHPWNAAIVQLHDGRVADGRDQPDLGDFYPDQGQPRTFEQQLALAESEMTTQVTDDRFTLDELSKLDRSPTSPVAGHLDLDHVGAFGHSFGGAVSAELARQDPRVRSAALLDGALSGPLTATALPKPLLRILAPPEPIAPNSENSPIAGTRLRARMRILGETAVMNSFEKEGGYQVIIGGIDHENFDDKGFFSPFHSLSGIDELPQARAAQIINAYITAFFQLTLRGQPQPLLSGPKSPFPEVLSFQHWQPSRYVNP